MHNKIPLFQILVLLILLSLTMVACNVTPPNVDSSPTSAPVKKTTPTPKPTKTPEPTATPTEVDPNRPLGTPGTDALGPYIEVMQNDVPVKLRQIEVSGGESLWAFSLNEGEKKISILNLREASNDIGLPDQLWLNVLVDSSAQGVDLIQKFKGGIRYEGVNNPSHLNFNDIFFDIIYKRIGKIKNSYVAINNGDVTVSFTTSEGEFDWKLGPNTSVTTIIRNFDDLPLELGNGVSEWKDMLNSSNLFRVKKYTVNGNLVTEVASKLPLDQLTEEELSAMYLMGPVSIADGDDQIVDSHFSEVFRLAKWAITDPYPFLVPVDSQ